MCIKTDSFKIKNIALIIAAIIIAIALFIGIILPINCKAEEKEEQNISQFFEGDGDAASPFLINSEEDFIKFMTLVNDGMNFDDNYFLQTANLNFTDLNINPVNKFSGIYDGGGKEIQGLKLKGDKVALFTDLDGGIFNLAVVGAEIEGEEGAVIALSSSANSSPVIANCYVSADINAQKAGAVAVNLKGGYILGCVSECDVPLVNGEVRSLYYNCSTRADIAVNFTGDAGDNVQNADYRAAMKNFEYLMYLNVSCYCSLNSFSQSEGAIFGEKYDFKGELKGKGTMASPYRIEDILDLVNLRNAVNGGENFAGKVFIQTEDISAEDIKNFIPIGIYGKLNYFYGVYDGNGKKVTGLNICKGLIGISNNGFFGSLGGIVMNLGLEDGNIEGNCVGSFASHSTGYGAAIINCYSNLSLTGNTRRGGIADNFSGGYILNCFYYSSQISIKVCSYKAGLLINSGSLSVQNEEDINGNFLNEEIGQETADRLNSSLVETSKVTDIALWKFNGWVYEDNELKLGEKMSFNFDTLIYYIDYTAVYIGVICIVVIGISAYLIIKRRGRGI